MGKGKGSPEYWVAVVKPGRVMFELEGLDDEIAKETFKQCGYKLPIKTKWWLKESYVDMADDLKKLNEKQLRSKPKDSQEA